MQVKPMSEMTVGEQGVVRSVKAEGTLRRHLLGLGLVPGTEVQCVGKAPFGDPLSFRVRNAVVALRGSDIRNIYVEIGIEKVFANRK